MPRTCLRQSHKLSTVRFPNGRWVAGCSCAEYMSLPYGSAAAAMVGAAREHRMAPSLREPS